MKVKVRRTNLLSHLQMSQNIVERKTTLPILSHILMETLPSQLKISSTDLEVGVTDMCEAERLENGNTTVHARKFFEIIRELPESEIELTQKDENLEIRSGRSRFKLRSLSSDEFPKIPPVQASDSIVLKGNILQEMIQKVSVSVSTDETKYTLTGVLTQMESLQEKTIFRMITTDGHRLSFCERVLPETKCLTSFFANKEEERKDIILPRKAVQEMRRLTEGNEDLEFGIFQENAFVRKENFSMIMRLVQGKFPDYRAVIPGKISRKMTVNSPQLDEALRRVSLLSTEKARGARFLVEKGKLTIFSNSPELGEAEEELDLDYSGESFELSFNIRYIIDFLQIAKGDVEMEFGEELRPCIMRDKSDPNSLYIVMPLRT
jgi:DNA polymerase III subunit beta